MQTNNEVQAPDDFLYVRDLDGTGSLHVCSKGDPGALLFQRVSETKQPLPTRRDPVDLARDFMAMELDEFRRFWATVQAEWNDPDGDMEAVWYLFGQRMGPREISVIGALHSAVASGQKHRA